MTDKTEAAAGIDAIIASSGDWRGDILARMRALILQADAEIVEAIKWIKPSNPLGVATWEHGGIICTGEIYKSHVKFTFAQGAAVEDPSGLFNAGFGGGTRRAIDLHEGETVDADAFKALVLAAVQVNAAKRDARS